MGKRQLINKYSYLLTYLLTYLLIHRAKHGQASTLSLCLKNVPIFTDYNFNTHPPIFIMFGRRYQQTFKNQLQA